MILVHRWGQKIGIFGPKSVPNCGDWYKHGCRFFLADSQCDSEGSHTSRKVRIISKKKLLEISELSHFIKSRCIVSTSEKYTEKHILDYSSSFNSVELTHSIISCVNAAKIPHTSFLCKVISQNTKFRNIFLGTMLRPSYKCSNLFHKYGEGYKNIFKPFKKQSVNVC